MSHVSGFTAAILLSLLPAAASAQSVPSLTEPASLPRIGRFARAIPPAPPADALAQQAVPSRPDSLKNGALIGALAGAGAGLYLSAVGCGYGNLWEEESPSSCAGGAIIVTSLTAGIGALIGVGIDALVDRGPAVMPRNIAPGGRRVGVRVRVSF